MTTGNQTIIEEILRAAIESAATFRGRAITALLALTACAFLLAPPTLAQVASDDPAAQAQDVEMPREVRVLVQRGLDLLGFDPGPADGLFGPKTRSAIWDWQAAKELDATGYLTLPEAEALAAIGAEGNETLEVEFEEPAEPEPFSTEAATASSGSRNQVLYFPTCGTDDARPDGCFVALSSPAECVMWLPYATVKEFYGALDESTISWSGECNDTGRASGRGTLNFDRSKSAIPDGEALTSTINFRLSGEIVEGKQQGHWSGTRSYASDVYNYPPEVEEGSFVNGLAHGQWLFHGGDACVRGGPYVNGVAHGQWSLRCSDGSYDSVFEYRNGVYVE